MTVSGTPVSVVHGDDGSTVLQWNGVPASVPFVGDRIYGIFAPDEQAVLAGRLPSGAATVEVAAPGGVRLAGAVNSGVWMAIVPDNHRGIEVYPVLFRDGRNAPVPRHLPAGWDRQAIARSESCPACGSAAWDLVTAEWEGEGPLRSTRWGQHGNQPGQAYVCRTCGYEQATGARWQYH